LNIIKFWWENCLKIYATQVVRIEALTREKLEDLGEALLDFNSLTDLQAWLAALAD
jgi:hypothetical protein